MLPPHEIKSKGFTHAIRGYSAEEVDGYAEFVLQKYTELYRQNDLLETQIAELQGAVEKYRTDEESIRSALVEAQRSGAKIVDEANERSKIILHSAKLECDRILSEFRSAVKEERDELLLLRGMVKKFKSELFLAYQTHIEYIEKIAPELDQLDESEFSDEAIIRLAVESIKADILKDHGGAENDAESIGTENAAKDSASEAEEIVSDESNEKIEDAAASSDDNAVRIQSEEVSEELAGDLSEEEDKSSELGLQTEQEIVYDENDLVSEILKSDVREDAESLSDVVGELENGISFNSDIDSAVTDGVTEADYTVVSRLEKLESDIASDSALGAERETIVGRRGTAETDDKSDINDEFLRIPEDYDDVNPGDAPEKSVGSDDSGERDFLMDGDGDDDKDYLDFLKDITNG